MTPAREEFEALGRRLFGRRPDGYGWEIDMARKTGSPIRTLRGWGREAKMPPAVLGLMRMLVEEKDKDMAGMDGETV